MCIITACSGFAYPPSFITTWKFLILSISSSFAITCLAVTHISIVSNSVSSVNLVTPCLTGATMECQAVEPRGDTKAKTARLCRKTCDVGIYK